MIDWCTMVLLYDEYLGSANNLPGYVIDYVKTRYVSACANCAAHLK